MVYIYTFKADLSLSFTSLPKILQGAAPNSNVNQTMSMYVACFSGEYRLLSWVSAKAHEGTGQDGR